MDVDAIQKLRVTYQNLIKGNAFWFVFIILVLSKLFITIRPCHTGVLIKLPKGFHLLIK